MAELDLLKQTMQNAQTAIEEYDRKLAELKEAHAEAKAALLRTAKQAASIAVAAHIPPGTMGLREGATHTVMAEPIINKEGCRGYAATLDGWPVIYFNLDGNITQDLREQYPFIDKAMELPSRAKVQALLKKAEHEYRYGEPRGMLTPCQILNNCGDNSKYSRSLRVWAGGRHKEFSEHHRAAETAKLAGIIDRMLAEKGIKAEKETNNHAEVVYTFKYTEAKK